MIAEPLENGLAVDIESGEVKKRWSPCNAGPIFVPFRRGNRWHYKQFASSSSG